MQPSLTAFGAAAHRAAHQVLDRGRIFLDPLALRILGTDAEAAIQEAKDDSSRRILRFFIAIRARFAEDALAAALARGTRQVVVLGAGLDTYAYRAALDEGVRVFEVDHPVTQAWKRERLVAAEIPLPRHLTFTAVDFERETLADGLLAAGFDPTAPTFFTWLGVVPYLSEDAIFSTLGFIAALSGGAQVVFDYGNPPALESPEEAYTTAHQALARRVASVGESFKSLFETEALHHRLSALGFRDLEDLGPSQIRGRYFPHLGPSLHERGGHILRASTRAV